MDGTELSYGASLAEDHDFATGAPVLIVGSGEQALTRGAATVAAAGLRIAGRVTVDEAMARLDQQIVTRALWIELEEDGGEAADRLLERVNCDCSASLYPAVIAAPERLIDTVLARVSEPAVELLIDAGMAERAAALAVATSGASAAKQVADAASDSSAARLRQLSEEVSRIATTLARLSGSGTESAGPPVVVESGQNLPAISVDDVRSVIRARRLRGKYFDQSLFADPAWDMLLDLTQAELAQYRVPVSSLCIAATVPATTALRWIKTMVEKGLFVRRSDPRDARRVFIELGAQASGAMRSYFAEVGRPQVV